MKRTYSLEGLSMLVEAAQMMRIAFTHRFKHKEVVEILIRFCDYDESTGMYSHTNEQADAFESFLSWKAAFIESSKHNVPMFWDDNLNSLQFVIPDNL